jgi:hypothetical protein
MELVLSMLTSRLGINSAEYSVSAYRDMYLWFKIIKEFGCYILGVIRTIDDIIYSCEKNEYGDWQMGKFSTSCFGNRLCIRTYLAHYYYCICVL